MATLLKMSWRNIWRNKRRTLITMASIFLAFFLSLLMRSWQLGSYGKMVHDVVSSYSGYAQIQAKGFWQEKTLEFTFEDVDSLSSLLAGIENVDLVLPRLESFALAAGALQTKGAAIVGIDPVQENKLIHLSDKVVQGRYFNGDGTGVLMAEKLAEYLKLTVGDTLVLLGQGYHGISAAGQYPILGLLHFASPQLNKEMVFMPLAACQYLYSADNRLTSLVINLRSEQKLPQTLVAIRSCLDPNTYAVLSWQDLLAEMVQQINSDNVSGMIMLGILYMIVAFGMFGTLLMMTSERTREFGVMIAVGMKKGRLTVMVLMETLMIALVSIVAGILASLPIIHYYHMHPISFSGEAAKSIESFGIDPVLPFAWQFSIFAHQSYLVMILMAVALIYPLFRINRIKVVSTLHR
jgi:putative ABC transport system permease protein